MGSFQGGQVSAVRDLLALVWAPSNCVVVDHNLRLSLCLSHTHRLSLLCHAVTHFLHSHTVVSVSGERGPVLPPEKTRGNRGTRKKSGRKMENYVTALTFGIFMLSKRHFFAWWLINSASALLFKKRKKRKSVFYKKKTFATIVITVHYLPALSHTSLSVHFAIVAKQVLNSLSTRRHFW